MIIRIENYDERIRVVKFAIKHYNLLLPLTPESQYECVNDKQYSGTQVNYKSIVLPSFGSYAIHMNEIETPWILKIEPDTTTNYVEHHEYSSRKIIFTIEIPDNNHQQFLSFMDKVMNDDTLLTDELHVLYNKYEENWCTLAHTVPQSLDDIYLPTGIKEEVISGIEKFISKRGKYIRTGRSHKFTYLLEGEPGTGKSCLIRAIAKKLGRKLYILNLGNENLNNNNLVSLFAEIKPNSILAIEDVDAYFKKREQQQCKVDFSTILNIFDGTMSNSNGLITFLTANNPLDLDSALVRPGRIDRVIHFTHLTREQYDHACENILKQDFIADGNAENDFVYTSDEELYTIVKINRLSMSALMDILFYGETPAERIRLARSQKRQFESQTNSMFL